MALTNQPYLPLYVQDWLSNNKLKICSPGAHGLMINIMCLMHKSDEYGTILLQQKFKQNEQQIINFATMVARLLPFEFAETLAYLTELLDEEILKIEDEKLICERMKKDAELSLKRSLVGSKGGKTTSKNNKNFATAKVQANSENEYENENVIEIKNEKKEKVLKEKPLENIYRSFAHLKLFESEYKILLETYSQKDIDRILDAIENFKQNTKYKSLFLTAKNWLENDKLKNPGKNGTKNQNFGVDARIERGGLFGKL